MTRLKRGYCEDNELRSKIQQETVECLGCTETINKTSAIEINGKFVCNFDCWLTFCKKEKETT
jgi:hypothetical protein